MSDLYLVIPMAGNGVRFKKNGHRVLKPLILIENEPMFLKSLKKILENTVNDFKVRIIIKEEDAIENMVRQLLPEAEIIVLKHSTQGALQTLYQGILDIEYGRLLSLDCDLECFSKGLDKHIFDRVEGPAVVTFDSCKTLYSYVNVRDRVVTQIKEKVVISNNAVAGLYYFNNIALFKKTCERVFESENMVMGEYYISMILNEFLSQKLKVVAYENTFYRSFGTPEEINNQSFNR